MECSSGVDPVGWQGGTGGAAASTGHQQGEWRTVIVSAGTSHPRETRDDRFEKILRSVVGSYTGLMNRLRGRRSF